MPQPEISLPNSIKQSTTHSNSSRHKGVGQMEDRLAQSLHKAAQQAQKIFVQKNYPCPFNHVIQ